MSKVRLVDTPGKIQDIIVGHMAANAAAAPVGSFIPLLDQGVVASSWCLMFGQIGSYLNNDFDKKAIVQIVTLAAKGIGVYMLGSKILAWATTFVFTGPAGPALCNAALNAYYTKVMGVSTYAVLKDNEGALAEEIAVQIRNQLMPLPSMDDIKEMYQFVKDVVR